MKKIALLVFAAGCHGGVTVPAEEPSCRAPDEPTQASCPANWTTAEVLACIKLDSPPKGCMKLDGPGYLVCCCEGWGDEFGDFDCGVEG